MADSISAVSNNISMQDFLSLLLTQLTQQDPLKPMDNAQFLAQLAQFTTLQQTAALNTNMQQSVSTQMASQSVALLGKNVAFTSEGGGLQQGVVIAVNLQGGTTPVFSVRVQVSGGGTKDINGVQMSQVTLVTN